MFWPRMYQNVSLYPVHIKNHSMCSCKRYWIYTHFTDINQNFQKFLNFIYVVIFVFHKTNGMICFLWFHCRRNRLSDVCQSLYQISALATLNLLGSLSKGPTNNHQHLLMNASHELGHMLSCVLSYLVEQSYE